MQPSAEALDWQRRADAWAQQAETENGQAVEPANRWSEVATGRPTFPADGVGWRTETAEWRATGARWRQTTEWRSTTGSHGFRSTTEAWQTGGSNAYPPQAETPMTQPAISSSAWRSDEPTDRTTDDPRPSWQQFTEPGPSGRQQSESWQSEDRPSWQTPDPPQANPPSWQQSQNGAPSWQQPQSGTPSWQQSQNGTPGWQQPQTDTPSWQQPQTETPSWQQPQTDTPSWNQSSWLQQEQPPTTPTRQTPARQQPGPRPPAEASPSWQQLVDPTAPPGPPPTGAPGTPGWRRGAIEGTATWTDLTDARSRSETPSWQRSDGLPEQPNSQRRDDSRHLVREDDRAAAWRRETGEGSPQVGRRRAPEPGSRTSGGTGWTARSDADNWAGHTDTGGIQLYPDPATPEAPSWGEPTGRRALPTTPHDEPTYQIPPATPYETGRRGRPADTTGTRALPPGRQDDAPRGRRRAEEPRTDASPPRRRAARYAEDEPDPGYSQRRAAAQSAAMPLDNRRLDETRSGRRRRDEAPPPVDRQAAAQAMPLERRPDEMPPPGRRGAPEAAPKGRAPYNPGRNDWREQTGSWDAEPDTSSWTRDPDTGQWSRAEDDPRVLAWRREAARREEMERNGGQRALPAGPASGNDEVDEPGGPIDDDDPPPRRGGPRGGGGMPPGGAAAPWSGSPYGGASAPRSGTPYGSPRGGTYGSAPRGGTYGGAADYDGPRGRALPAEEPGYDSPRGGAAPGYGAPPRNALPAGPGFDTPRGSATPASAPPRFTGSAPASGVPYGGAAPGTTYGGAPTGAPRSGTPYGAASAPPGRRRAELDGPPGAVPADVFEKPAVDPELWRREPESPESRQNRRLGVTDDAPPSWAERGDPSTDHRQRLQPGEWNRLERQERARGSAVYRDSGDADWRRDLAEQSDLAEGESRRYGTSDFIPFQSSGSAAVPRSSNLSMTSTSLISPVPREQREAEA
ncbi:MAG: hypothetical protein ABW022_04830, partial [Actinoplanes sp.]